MTDNAVLLAGRISIAVLTPLGAIASHVASPAFYKQITTNPFHIRQYHYYIPAAQKFRTFLERSSVLGELIFHTS